MRSGGQPTILHADLDAFYASVEQLLDPSLQGRPIAVGGGVVLAASYEAKAFGVFGGMSGDEAFMEVAGSTHLFGTPTDIAVAIRSRVREETGLPVSSRTLERIA